MICSLRVSASLFPRLRIEGRQRGHGGHEHPHRVRVVVEAVDELLDVLVDPRVVRDLVDPVIHLAQGRQLAVQEQVGHLEVVGALGQLLDGIAPVAQDAAVAIDLGDPARRGRGVHEGGIVGEQAEVVRPRADLPQVHGPDGAVGDGNVVGLPGAVVGDRQAVGRHAHPPWWLSGSAPVRLGVTPSQQQLPDQTDEDLGGERLRQERRGAGSQGGLSGRPGGQAGGHEHRRRRG